MKAVRTGKVSWYDPKDVTGYRCDGLDPKTFPNRGGAKAEVPFKYWSENHHVALEWFARAARAGRTAGLPSSLLTASLSIHAFLEHILRGDIVIHSETKTCGFTKPFNQNNYPGLDVELTDYSDDVAQSMLEYATMHLL